MYSISIDDNLVYRANAVDINRVVESATMTEAINEPAVLTVVVPSNNPTYGQWQKRKSLVLVKNDDDEILFRGYITEISYDFYNSATLICESDLTFLNDTEVGPLSIYSLPLRSVLGYIIHIHNSFMDVVWNDNEASDDFKKFALGTVDSSFSEIVETIETEEYINTMDFINEYVLEPYEAMIEVRHTNTANYLDFKKKEMANVPTPISGQVIRFGENMIDFQQIADTSEVCTVVIPLGAKDENNHRITLVDGGYSHEYMTSSNITRYGRIVKSIIYDDITNPEYLATEGSRYLRQHFVEQTTFEISAIDLSLLGVDTSRFLLGQYNYVVSDPHGVRDYFQLTATSRDLMNPANDVYTFGTVLNKITDSVAKLNKKMAKG